jgi:hypothetical protein
MITWSHDIFFSNTTYKYRIYIDVYMDMHGLNIGFNGPKVGKKLKYTP